MATHTRAVGNAYKAYQISPRVSKIQEKLQRLAFKSDKDIDDSLIPYPRKSYNEIEKTRPSGTKQNYEQSQKEGEYILHKTKIRPTKPIDKDYQRIISASLDDLKNSLMEAKIAIAHNHRIEWRSTKIASQGEPKSPKMVGKYAKYWLLNAKDVNGNGWGVNKESIDHNIGYFVNRPFVITAKSWVPNSAYDTYDHPYLPTNDLYAVLKHQEPYRVGTIREVTHEGDDYYAIIEMLPKYAHMALPAFCSPAIFQVDYREPEDNISKWIPLHLAGLDTSPAYGARIALLKGSCLGTSNQCSIQLKTAKLLTAATGIDFVDDKDREANMKKGEGTAKQPHEIFQERVDALGKPKSTTQAEENARNQYIQFGDKIRPKKPTEADFNKIIQARLNILGARFLGAKENEEDHDIIETATQIYTANALGYVETPTGPKCGSCIWFEKNDSECMLIKDRKVDEKNGCCDAWIDPEHAKSGEYTEKISKVEYNPETDKEMTAKVICPVMIAQKLQKLADADDLAEENMSYCPDCDIKHPKGQHIDIDSINERLQEQRDRRFRSDIDRHVMRGGKVLESRLQRLAVEQLPGTQKIQTGYKIKTSPSVKINPEHGKIIANAYGEMKHDPSNPEVKKSYDALISETGKQYSDLRRGGLKIDKIKPGQTPYKNSQDMHKDVGENNHLYYFPTEHGFGQGEENKDHPMMKETKFKHEGKPMLANDVFRIVHDINGHHMGGMSGFGPKGEHQAYLTHKKMYSPTAHKALFTETAAQNNYVNFGPNGEHNRSNPKDTIYAPQKAGILPSKITNGNFHVESPKVAQLYAKLDGLVLVAGMSEVVTAFKNKQPLKSGNYESTGKSFHLFGNKIAEHSDEGLRVSNAGYDTPTTYKALKHLGVKAEVKGGVAHINDKPYTKHGSFVTVPYKDVSDKSLIVSKKSTKPREGFSTTPEINKLRQFADKARKRDKFLDQTAIQPEHQKIINKITGLKTKIPRKVIGTSVHHIFPKSAMPGLAHNLNNAITMNRNNHAELHRLNPEIVKRSKQIEGKLQKLANDDPLGIERNLGIKKSPQEKRLDELFMRDVKPPQSKHEEYHIQKYVDKGIKIRPPKPTQKDRVRIISARLQKLAMGNLETDKDKILSRFNSSLEKYRKSVKGEHEAQSLNSEDFKEVFRTDAVKHGNRYKKLTGQHPEGMEEVTKGTIKKAAQETVPDFKEARIRYNLNKAGGRIHHQGGFSYVPGDNSLYDANKKEDALKLQRRFGNGKDPLHIIARTDNHSEKLDDSHKFNGKTLKEHYDDIVKEGKTPVIGGFDENGDKTTDITTVEPMRDEEAKSRLKKFNQRSSGRVDVDGKFSIFEA